MAVRPARKVAAGLSLPRVGGARRSWPAVLHPASCVELRWGWLPRLWRRRLVPAQAQGMVAEPSFFSFAHPLLHQDDGGAAGRGRKSGARAAGSGARMARPGP